MEEVTPSSEIAEETAAQKFRAAILQELQSQPRKTDDELFKAIFLHWANAHGIRIEGIERAITPVLQNTLKRKVKEKNAKRSQQERFADCVSAVFQKSIERTFRENIKILVGNASQDIFSTFTESQSAYSEKHGPPSSVTQKRISDTVNMGLLITRDLLSSLTTHNDEKPFGSPGTGRSLGQRVGSGKTNS